MARPGRLLGELVAQRRPGGLRLIHRHRPAVLWSNFPIATEHLIALMLHRLTRLPWVADFRDSMTEEYYPRDPMTWRTCFGIERAVAARASLLVFTAERMREMYLDAIRRSVTDVVR